MIRSFLYHGWRDTSFCRHYEITSTSIRKRRDNAKEGKILAGRTALINEILSLSDTAGLRASASAG